MKHRLSNPLLAAGVAILLTFAARAQRRINSLSSKRQAKSLLAEGRFAEAIPLYEELVKALPQSGVAAQSRHCRARGWPRSRGSCDSRRSVAWIGSPQNLGQYLLMDYMNRKTRTIH